MPQIYVVIPIRNRKAITRDSLTCLSRQSARNFQVIVVDDGSTDGSAEMIASEFPGVTVLTGDGNLWWTGAVNMGIQHAMQQCEPEDYALLLNDDLLLDDNYVENINTTIERNPNAIIGSAVLDSSDRDTIVFTGMTIDWVRVKSYYPDVGKKRSSFPAGHCIEVSTLTGRGVLLPVRVFAQVGLYNERHYKHYGDLELPRRAVKAGYRLLICYDMLVYNHWSEPINKGGWGSYWANPKTYFWNYKSFADLRFRFWFAYDTTSNIFHGT